MCLRSPQGSRGLASGSFNPLHSHPPQMIAPIYISPPHLHLPFSSPQCDVISTNVSGNEMEQEGITAHFLFYTVHFSYSLIAGNYAT